MATPTKSDLEKALTTAERLLREVTAIPSQGKVADNSLYWAKFSANNAVKYLRDCIAEQGLDTKDFVVVSDGESGYSIITDPDTKWKILHNVKETQDDKRKPWLRAISGE